MAYTGDRVSRAAGKVEDAVARVGRPRRQFAPRLVMVLAALLIATVVLAFALNIAKGGGVGWDLAVLAMVLSGILVLFSPLVGRPPSGEWDERERGLRTKATGISGQICLLIIVFVASYNSATVPKNHFWVPSSQEDWRLVACGLVALWNSIAIFAAAWFTPPYAAELDEEEG